MTLQATQPVQPTSPPQLRQVAEFARALADVRREAGFTMRRLARATAYSHSAIVRATAGHKLPSWGLTQAILAACGISGEDLKPWKRLWDAAKAEERQLRSRRRTRHHHQLKDADWRDAVSTVRELESLLTIVRQASTVAALSLALHHLGQRSGADSLRKVEAKTGIPRATLHGWYSGKRRPSVDRLDQLVVGLGASSTEQQEFAKCLERVAETVGCDGVHPTSGRPCLLNRQHRGSHRTANGERWLDE